MFKNKKIIIILSIFLIMSMSIATVKADDINQIIEVVLGLGGTPINSYDFTQTYNGNWDTASFPNYSKKTLTQIDTGRANITYTKTLQVTNESGGIFGIDLRLNQITGNRINWYDWEGTMTYATVIDIYNGNEHIYAMFYIKHIDGMFSDSAELRVGTKAESVYQKSMGSTGGGGIKNPQYGVSLPIVGGNYIYVANTSYLMLFQRLNSTCTAVDYANIHDLYAENFFLTDSMYYTEYFTNSANFWDNAQMRIYTQYVGSGLINVKYNAMTINENPSYYNRAEWIDNQQKGNLDSQNDNWWAKAYNLLQQLWQIGVWLLQFLISGLVAIAPYLGWFLIIYGLDAVITSVATGSFTPIGMLMQTVWSFVIGVYEILRGLLDLILRAIDIVIPDWL